MQPGDRSPEDVEEIHLDFDIDPVFTQGESVEVYDLPPASTRRLPLPAAPTQLFDHVIDGGPPLDGIPSIDEPTFVASDEVGSLLDGDVVFGVRRNSEIKAYPRRILVYHEIVNDTIGGEPVSVTYCPLTGTAQGFERGDTEFGVSGRLLNNNLIMYDRASERWWLQIPAVSIPSRWSGNPGGVTLREFELVRTTWEHWREAHPDTLVLSEDTGYVRNYGTDPYEAQHDYSEQDNTIFESLYSSDRHHAKRWVYGVRTETGTAAVLADTLRATGVVNGRLRDDPIVFVFDPDLETAYAYRRPDNIRFDFKDGQVVADSGERYAPDDLPYERLIAVDAFWFAWVAYYPQTVVYE